MRVSLTTLLIVSCCIGAGTARATLIAPETQHPLVNTSQVRVQYKGQEGTLEAKSKKPLVTIDFTPDGTKWYSGAGGFSLITHVSANDGTLISGSVEITTLTGEAGFPEGATTTAELNQFGYDFNTPQLDFQFVHAVGEPQDNPFIETITQPIAALNMIVTLGALDSNPCPVDFSKSWSKQGKGSGLVGIPEPSTMALLALGGAGPDPSSPPEPLAIWAVPSS